MEQEQPKSLEDIIARSRRELGLATMHAASRSAITPDEAKALNFHLGIADHTLLLTYDKRKKKATYLEGIADAIRLRRLHLRTNRIIPMTGNLVERKLLAAAVGELDGEPLNRQGLLQLDTVQAISEKRKINPNIVVDQVIINDLDWLAVSTLPKNR